MAFCRLRSLGISRRDDNAEIAEHHKFEVLWILFGSSAQSFRCFLDGCSRRSKDPSLERPGGRHQGANKSYMDGGVRLLELARSAQRLFKRQEPREKRRLLNFLVSNCSWKRGELTVTLRQPFDILAETTLALEKKRADGGIANDPSQIWLPGPDSNQRPSG